MLRFAGHGRTSLTIPDYGTKYVMCVFIALASLNTCRLISHHLAICKLVLSLLLSSCYGSIEDSSLIHVVSKHRTILGHLNLKGCSLLTADSFKYIGQCQNLQDLNMSECGMIKAGWLMHTHCISPLPPGRCH